MIDGDETGRAPINRGGGGEVQGRRGGGIRVKRTCARVCLCGGELTRPSPTSPAFPRSMLQHTPIISTPSTTDRISVGRPQCCQMLPSIMENGSFKIPIVVAEVLNDACVHVPHPRIFTTRHAPDPHPAWGQARGHSWGGGALVGCHDPRAPLTAHALPKGEDGLGDRRGPLHGAQLCCGNQGLGSWT